MRKQQYSADQWVAAVEEWSKKGISKKCYCIEHELIYSTFCYWARKRQADSSGKEPESVLHAIEVTTDCVHGAFPKGWPSPSAELDTHGIILTLRESEATVTISGRVSLQRLGRIMAACESIDYARA